MVEPVLLVKRLRTWSAIAAVALGLVYAAVIWRSGARLSPDSATYSRWADALVAVGFDYGAYLTTTTFVVPPVLYVLWITTVALCKVLLGTGWPAGILVLNWISATALVYALTQTTGRLTGSVILGLAATGLSATSVDTLGFMAFALSDIIFLGLASAVLFLGLSMASGASPERRRRQLLAGTALVILGSLFRPTGPPLMVFWLAAVGLAFSPTLRPRQAWTILGVLAAMGLAGIFVQAAMMQNPSGWAALGGQSGWMQQLSAEARKGIVVFDRPYTYVPEPTSFADFVRLTLTKWAYYFAPWLAAYSRFHQAADAAFFLTTYGLAIVAVRRSPRWRATSLLVLYVLAFSLYHAVQQIDYDHRYRLPVLPALCVLAALGLEAVLTSAARRRIGAQPAA